MNTLRRWQRNLTRPFPENARDVPRLLRCHTPISVIIFLLLIGGLIFLPRNELFRQDASVTTGHINYLHWGRTHLYTPIAIVFSLVAWSAMGFRRRLYRYFTRKNRVIDETLRIIGEMLAGPDRPGTVIINSLAGVSPSYSRPATGRRLGRFDCSGPVWQPLARVWAKLIHWRELSSDADIHTCSTSRRETPQVR